MNRETLLMNMYRDMLKALEPEDWWPASTPFEVTVGAILTQNTNWGNVEKAIRNLKQADVLNPRAMAALSEEELAQLIRPSGYFRIKAKRLQALLEFIFSFAGDSPADHALCQLHFLAAKEPEELRPALLAVKGIGPETADAILLYALHKPGFVVDTYTHRILTRHGLIPEEAQYGEIQDFFMDVLCPDVALFSEYHALLVRVAKNWCRKRKPHCASCPLKGYLPPLSPLAPLAPPA